MNIGELGQYAQLGGTVVTVIAFIIYLKGRDGEFSKAVCLFNKTVSDYLKNSTKAQQVLAKQLQRFADASNQQTAMIKELRESNQVIYKELVKVKNPKLYEQIHSDDRKQSGR